MKEKCNGKGWTSDTAFTVWTTGRGTCSECGQDVRATVRNVPKTHWITTKEPATV